MIVSVATQVTFVNEAHMQVEHYTVYLSISTALSLSLPPTYTNGTKQVQQVIVARSTPVRQVQCGQMENVSLYEKPQLRNNHRNRIFGGPSGILWYLRIFAN